MQAAPRSVLITGANRGIGLAFVRQLLALPTPPVHLIATCRAPEKATELSDIAKENSCVKVLQLDLDDFDALSSMGNEVAKVVGEDGLNLLISNAGISGNTTFDTITPEALMESFKINAVAPLMVTKALLPLLKKTAANFPSELGCLKSMVAFISTKVASIEDNSGGQLYDYRPAKTALNMIMKNLSIDLEPQGILTLALHPGWVKTDLGGPNALTEASESVDGMLKIIAKASENDSGKFYDFRGIPIPW